MCIHSHHWLENWKANEQFDLHDTEATRMALLDEFHDRDPELLDLVRHGQDPAPRSLFMLPVGWS